VGWGAGGGQIASRVVKMYESIAGVQAENYMCMYLPFTLFKIHTYL
jgi:hypothetical protein